MYITSNYLFMYCGSFSFSGNLRLRLVNVRAGSSEKGAYGFPDVMRANDVYDVIYDVTLGNVKHLSQTF